MARRWLILGAFAVAAAASPQSASAQKRPIQLSLVNPIQIYDEADTIAGFRLNLIYGRNATVYGFDLGIVNHTTTGPVKGVQWGIVGLADAGFMGWQRNFVNVSKGKFEGLQGGLVNVSERVGGVQSAWVNVTEAMKGFQLGYVNVTQEMGGFQLAAVNYSRDMDGLQLSLVNYAKKMHGVQIGLINIISEGGVLPVMPIVNWSF